MSIIVPELVLIVGKYLFACAVAYCLHETAHYFVHRRYAESVSFGLNRWGHYVDAVYEPTAPTVVIRLGSIAPTLIYGLLLIFVVLTYV